MVEKDDWRLQGQEKYLKGVTLFRRAYRRCGKNPNWDHDHCEFCLTKFTVEDHTAGLHVGYATEDDYRWICEACFHDFKDMFRWEVIEVEG